MGNGFLEPCDLGWLTVKILDRAWRIVAKCCQASTLGNRQTVPRNWDAEVWGRWQRRPIAAEHSLHLLLTLLCAHGGVAANRQGTIIFGLLAEQLSLSAGDVLMPLT